MMDLRGKHVAVTGASSGIGEAVAREAARAGARITLVARRRERLERLANELGAEVHVAVHDLSHPARAADWIAPAEAALGPIDLLVNNAGAECVGPTVGLDPGAGASVLALNLESPLRIVAALLPRLVRRGGAIVNVASVAALAPPPQFAWYAASKGGLASFSESLASELARAGVQVLTVYPGPVTTELGERGYAAVGGRTGAVGALPEGKPDVLARRILDALRRGKTRLVYPRFYALAWWFPWFARWLTDRVAPKAPKLASPPRARLATARLPEKSSRCASPPA